MVKTLNEKLLRRNLKVNQEKKNLLQETNGPVVVTSVCNGTTDATFSDLAARGVLQEATLKALQAMGLSHLTEIQRRIYDILLGAQTLQSVKAIAKTGSGKTLAYLLPIVNLLNDPSLRIKQSTGTVAVVVCPTGELAMQTYGVLCDLLQGGPRSACLVRGGRPKKDEARELYWGASVVVGTPGRLLDHLGHTDGFTLHNLACVVVDEADRMFEHGFSREMKQLLYAFKRIREEHQILLFSATDDPRVDEVLAEVYPGYKDSFRLIALRDEQATVGQLEQEVVLVRSEERFLCLYAVLSCVRNSKVMVFVNTWVSVALIQRLLSALGIPCLGIHGQLPQETRTSLFNKFNRLESGVLLSTNVGARGWDVSSVALIIQYDPPDDPNDYIHRVGRTARVGRAGKALLMLRREEHAYLSLMEKHRVNISHRREFCQATLQSRYGKNYQKLVEFVQSNEFLNNLAKNACAKFIRLYSSKRLKSILDPDTLDHDKVAQGYLLQSAAGLQHASDEQVTRSLLRGAGKQLKAKAKYKKAYAKRAKRIKVQK